MLGLCLLAGCRGGGQLQFADLNYAAIDPPSPRFQTIEIERCYWWTDDAGQVWIAMEHDRAVLPGVEPFVLRMSLVLEKLPAGRARNYLVQQRELRAVARLGPAEGRFVSLAGIVALYREPNERLRGSFRLEVSREISKLLGGWGRPSRNLMQGTFVAIPDTGRGREIATETELYGWDREPRQPPPATRPTVAP